MNGLALALFWLAATSPAVAADGAAAVRAGADGRGEVRATIDIPAPPERVWRTILDCRLASRMTPSVKRCTVLERSPDGRAETREHWIKRGLFSPMLRSVSRLELDPSRRIGFRCIGGDIDDCEGQWLLTPLENGTATRVVYENKVSAPFGLPAGMAAAAMRRDVPAALQALRRECLGDRP
ncbi:SRPBCC family protein [Caulobacter endophyticus]|uniref:Cyclase n=1 Tax=Caulobacter endophyticus TaxID=2172652 RepID=A0A2T9JLQ8_9CAUL|nr:SRPBCC family protein [Caulobacter endophyticus]PVM84608.1 cyclase [Caulobacter endophyticus]